MRHSNPPGSSLLAPGRNCWRVERAHSIVKAAEKAASRHGVTLLVQLTPVSA